MTDFTTHIVRQKGSWEGAFDRCVLSYADRFVRRKVLQTEAAGTVLVDLAQTVSLNHGDAFETSDGRLIEIVAASEPLLQVTGDLLRFAWHIGNRHTPCQIAQDCLLIQDDHVIGHMLEHLGATLTRVQQPFTPEGGAYGHGRTHSHAHGATAHDHHH